MRMDRRRNRMWWWLVGYLACIASLGLVLGTQGIRYNTVGCHLIFFVVILATICGSHVIADE